MLHNKHSKGFTIVELLIVIVVIGILAAITIVSFNGVQAKAKTTKMQSSASSILKKLETYNTTIGTYPDITQNWYDQSDMSSSDPTTKLPTNMRVIRGNDNATDGAVDYDSTVDEMERSPAVYTFIVCKSGGTATGVKVPYPNYSTKTMQFLRSGSCA